MLDRTFQLYEGAHINDGILHRAAAFGMSPGDAANYVTASVALSIAGLFVGMAAVRGLA